MDFIEKEEFPNDIVVIDEDEFADFGFVIDLDELHAYIVDQCGHLAYIVVPPWSSAQHPYVKAAVISSILDLPCGCPSSQFASNMMEIATEIQTETESSTDSEPTQETSTLMMNIPVIDIDTDEIENIEDLLDNSNSLNHSQQESSDYEIPLRIVIPSMHMHYDNKTQNYWKYDQIVLMTGNQSYHDHLQNGEKLLEIQSDRRNFENITEIDAKIFVGNRSFSDIQAVAQSKQVFADRLGKSYKIHKEFISGEKFFELVPVDFDIVKVNPVQKIYGVRHHYEQLNRWLMFKV